MLVKCYSLEYSVKVILLLVLGKSEIQKMKCLQRYKKLEVIKLGKKI